MDIHGSYGCEGSRSTPAEFHSGHVIRNERGTEWAYVEERDVWVTNELVRVRSGSVNRALVGQPHAQPGTIHLGISSVAAGNRPVTVPFLPVPIGGKPHVVRVGVVFELDPHGEEPDQESYEMVQRSARNAMAVHLLSHSRVAEGDEHWDIRYFRLPEPGGMPANTTLIDGRPAIGCRDPRDGAQLIQVTLYRDSVQLGSTRKRGGPVDG